MKNIFWQETLKLKKKINHKQNSLKMPQAWRSGLAMQFLIETWHFEKLKVPGCGIIADWSIKKLILIHPVS